MWFDFMTVFMCVRACVRVRPGDLSHHGVSQKDEVSVLQAALAALDREKDALQDTVDQKTETLALLQEELHSKVHSTHWHWDM